MLDESDGLVTSLINTVKNLFNGPDKAKAPSMVEPSISKTNLKPSKSGYQAPIQTSWNNSGGFNLTARRPNGRTGHQGVDMRAPAGTPIYPLAEGVVSNVGTDPVGGNVINIQHANGVRTYYAHLATVRVHKGDKVNLDTVIGTVGDSGNASGTYPHLHFQVWKDNQITDPANFFSIPKYTDLSAEEKKNGRWLSQQAKQEAQAFNMKSHNVQKRVAFTNDVNKLLKIANQYSKLI